MSQRNVQLVIGRLVTDEALRQRFLRAPTRTLDELSDVGWEMSRGEKDALLEVDTHLWSRIAAKLPSRLQQCVLGEEASDTCK